MLASRCSAEQENHPEADGSYFKKNTFISWWFEPMTFYKIIFYPVPSRKMILTYWDWLVYR